MMHLISETYRALQTDLHSRFNYGHGGDAKECADLVRSLKPHTVLDYGCGQGHLKRLLVTEFSVEEYDPAIDGKDEEPSRADVVVCADVLEHIEPDLLGNVLLHLYALTRKRLILVIATRPSSKIMADGRSAHLIVENADWWRAKLSGLFEFDRFEDRDAAGHGVLAICRPRSFDVPQLVPIVKIRSMSAVSDADRNAQVRTNCARIAKRLDINLPAHDRTAHLVCYGPSLKDTWPSVALASAMGEDVFTVSGAHRFMIDRNIIPFAHIDCDPRPHKAEQIGKPHLDVRYWLASCISPAYLDKLSIHDVSLWHSYNGKASRIVFKLEPGQQMVVGGGSVGLRAMSILYARGYRRFEIHGMDASFENGEAHAGGHLGKPLEAVPVKCGDRWFDSSAVFILYARFFNKQFSMMPDAEIHLHGDGLLQHMQKTGVEVWATLPT